MKTTTPILLSFAGLLLVSCYKEPPPTVQQPLCSTCGYSYTGSSRYADIGTVGGDNWDYWQMNIGDTTGLFETVGSENWDYWHFNLGGTPGYIETVGSANWDYWTLRTGSRTIYIETIGSDNWDYWHIQESSLGFSATVETMGSDNFDAWNVYVNGTFAFGMTTSGSENWNNWRFAVNDLSGMDLPQLAAVFFIPVYTSAIHQRGIDL